MTAPHDVFCNFERDSVRRRCNGNLSEQKPANDRSARFMPTHFARRSAGLQVLRVAQTEFGTLGPPVSVYLFDSRRITSRDTTMQINQILQ
jgi:hypothetical protein